MKIRVGILDQDQIYVSRVIRYFTTYYFDKLELAVFHDIDNFLEHIQHTKIDVFLANPNLILKDIELPKTVIMAYLLESPQAQTVNDIKAICKYQRAEMIYREILSLYAELDKQTVYKEAEGEGHIYFFMGSSGGVGTTTLAVACAMSLASYGKKVLYLNLEENGVVAPFLQGDGNTTLSDVLYSVKSNRSNLALKLESMVRKSEQGVYFYDSFAVALDAHEMSEDELKEIISTIMQYLSYDYIIVDSDSMTLWKRDLLIKYARNIFIVCDGKEVSSQKLERLLNEFTIKDRQKEERTITKVKVIYNRHKKQGRKIDAVYQENIYGTLNEMEEGLPKDIAEEISRTPFFDKLIL